MGIMRVYRQGGVETRGLIKSGFRFNIAITSITNIKSITLYLILLLCVALQGCTGAEDSDDQQSSNGPSVIGLSTFQTQCSQCHGLDGEGSATVPGLKRKLSQDELEFIIAYAMPPADPGACTGACASETAHFVFNTFTSDTGPIINNPSTGASLYNAGCASCHGEDGEGVGSIPGVTRDLTIEDLTTIVENRMPPINPGACVGECASLTAEYIFYTFAVPSDTPPAPPPEVSNGASLYTFYCSECHGVDGLGVGAVIGLTRDLSVAELTNIIQTTMPILDPNDCVGSCASETALYVYNNFRIPNTTPSPVQTNGETTYLQGCADCHGLDGRGVLTITGVTRNMPLSELTSIIETTMPPTSPESCAGICASGVAQYIFDSFTLPEDTTLPPAPPVATGGEALYTSEGCAGCHGLNGQGTEGIIGVTRSMSQTTLESIITTSMPPTDPTLCAGSCAADIAEYIFTTFTDPNAIVVTDDPLANLPKGQVQTNIACERMAQSGADNVVRDLFCGAQPASITGLVDLQVGLGLEFVSPNATGRRNNGRRGNPNFAITGHSSSLVGKFVNAINPRVIIFSRPGPGFIALGFTRGDQFVELITRDRNRNQLSFFLVAFEQACNVTDSCSFGDLLTPAIESNWTLVTLYGEEDIKNTIFDCQQCHQVDGPGTEKILRMQELRDPWNHWFRNNRQGGIVLLNDFEAAHGTGEDYGGIPAALIDAADPAELEDFVVANGFANQPNIFNSNRIQNEVNQTPGQPANNDVPGTSPTWNRLYTRSLQGLAIPPPYHDIKVTDSSKLVSLTAAYQSFLNGTLAVDALPDLRDAFLDIRLYEIGFAVDPALDAQGILMQACSQCHNSRLDQTISRSRFNVDLNAMSDTLGGTLTGSARDIEIGVAIERLLLPSDNIKIMPPSYSFRDLTADQIATVVAYLCSQTSTLISQCQ